MAVISRWPPFVFSLPEFADKGKLEVARAHLGSPSRHDRLVHLAPTSFRWMWSHDASCRELSREPGHEALQPALVVGIERTGSVGVDVENGDKGTRRIEHRNDDLGP